MSYTCLIEFHNNNGARYSIKTNIQLTKMYKDEDNIKILFPSKEDIINFEFDTQEDDIFISMDIEKIGKLEFKNKNEFRLNHTPDKYKRRLAHKIKWDLKTNKKKIKVKFIIINKNNNSNIYEILNKYAILP